MRYPKRTAILKNGLEAVIRNAEGRDAEAMLFHLRLTSCETDNMLRYPDEITMTPDNERAYILSVERDPKAVLLSAYINGELAASAGITPSLPFSKCLHRADFGISVKRCFWGIGLGTLLTAACIECARIAGYTRLELDVVSDNEHAIALYRSAGFTVYGIRKRAFRLRSGEYQDCLLMAYEF